MFARNLLFTIGPALIIVLWACRRTLGVREALISLALGAGAVVLALGLGLLLPAGVGRGATVRALLLRSFVVTALVEELARLAAVTVAQTQVRGSARVIGLRCGVLVGCGFAITESLLVLGRSSTVLMLRAATTLPMHAVLGGVAGLAVSSLHHRKSKNPLVLIPAGLAIAVALHGSYNLLLRLNAPLNGITLPLVAAGVTTVLLMDSRARSKP